MFWETLSSFVSAVGAIQQGNAAVKAAAFNENMSRFNASITKQQGAIEEDRVRRQGRQATGRIRANIGASGIDGGSADDVLFSSMYEAELDALTTRYNYSNQATAYEMQAQMYNRAGSDARTASYIGAASSLLRGATSYYKNNADYSGGPFKLGGGKSKTTTLSDGSQIIWD